MTQFDIPNRGEVWLVSLDPTLGHEIQKTRPAIVVSNDTYNRLNWVVIVVPVSSHDRAEYDQVLLEPPEGGLSSRCVTLPDQIRAIDRRRLAKRLGRLSSSSLEKLDQTLKIALDLQ
jgi:mRNA interferase MazF